MVLILVGGMRESELLELLLKWAIAAYLSSGGRQNARYKGFIYRHFRAHCNSCKETAKAGKISHARANSGLRTVDEETWEESRQPFVEHAFNHAFQTAV
jgi:hypothetical protein